MLHDKSFCLEVLLVPAPFFKGTGTSNSYLEFLQDMFMSPLENSGVCQLTAFSEQESSRQHIAVGLFEYSFDNQAILNWYLDHFLYQCSWTSCAPSFRACVIYASDYNAVALKNAITLAVCDITQNIVGSCTEFCMLSSGGCMERGT